ncbi:MAG: hypothetical protein ACK5P5_06905 [Pseudobdellovibrionaceae bacterium]
MKLLFVFLTLFLYLNKGLTEKKSQDPLLKLPTHAEFKRLKQSQKIELVLGLQEFVSSLSRDPSFKPSAIVPKEKLDMFVLLFEQSLIQEAQAQNGNEGEAEGQRLLQLQQRAASLRERMSVEQTLLAAEELRLANLEDAENERLRDVPTGASRLPPAELLEQRRLVQRLRARMTEQQQGLTAAEGMARGLSGARGRQESAVIPGTPPPPGQKYSCIYAGFGIPDSAPCRAPFEWTGKLSAQAPAVKLSCREATNANATPPVVGSTDINLKVLCNPVLFGTNEGNPICVNQNADATRACLARSTSLNNLDKVIAIIEANPEQYTSLMEMYGRLCQGASATQIADYLETNREIVLRRSTPPARINDISVTCERFRDQYARVYERAGASGRRGSVNVDPATGRR